MYRSRSARNTLTLLLLLLIPFTCLVLMNLLERGLTEASTPLRKIGIFGEMQSSDSPIFRFVDAVATYFAAIFSEIFATLSQFDPRQLLPVIGMVVAMVAMSAFWFAVEAIIRRRKEPKVASAAYGKKLQKAAEIVTTLPLDDAFATNTGLHALTLPTRQATRFLKSAELLSMRVNDAHLDYVRYINDSELDTTRRTATWYNEHIKRFEPILKELESCRDEWQTFDGSIQTAQQKSMPDALNKRLLVLEVALEDAREILPAKKQYGFKADHTKQCEDLIHQVTTLRYQFDNDTRTAWEIHTALEKVEKAASEFSPARLAELAKQ